MNAPDLTGPRTALAGLKAARWSQYVVYVGFVVVFLFFAITQTQYFLNPTNLSNIVVQTVPITVMAIGAVFMWICALESRGLWRPPRPIPQRCWR